jgi:hypothetical protein
MTIEVTDEMLSTALDQLCSNGAGCAACVADALAAVLAIVERDCLAPLRQAVIAVAAHEKQMRDLVNAVGDVLNTWQTRYEREGHDSDLVAFYCDVLNAVNGGPS